MAPSDSFAKYLFTWTHRKKENKKSKVTLKTKDKKDIYSKPSVSELTEVTAEVYLCI